MQQYWVYIICSKKHGTLYIGVTNDISRRAYEHKHNLIEGFSKKYSVINLVHAEPFHNINEALTREKQLKKWNRSWKIELIEKHNPEWSDLYDTLV